MIFGIAKPPAREKWSKACEMKKQYLLLLVKKSGVGDVGEEEAEGMCVCVC